MPINAPWNYPTLKCTPPDAGGVFPTETVLPLEPEAYAGLGPMVLVESPAPF